MRSYTKLVGRGLKKKKKKTSSSRGGFNINSVRGGDEWTRQCQRPRRERLVRTGERARCEVVEDEGGAGLHVVHRVVPKLRRRPEQRALVTLLLGGVVAQKHEKSGGGGP